MKKIIKAFTYIELLVVVTIITLLSSAWVFYFLDFVQDQEINNKLFIIEDNLDSLDRQIKKHEIFDYQAIFNTSNTWSKLYITYINIFDSKKQMINFLNSTWSWNILANLEWTWTIKIYKENKLFINETINRNNDWKYSFNDNQYYKIEWTASWKILNDIYINYYSLDNTKPGNNNLLELIKISSKEDKSWNSYSNIKIENIGWIKKFYEWNTEILWIDKIFLFFENNWKEQYINIEK